MRWQFLILMASILTWVFAEEDSRLVHKFDNTIHPAHPAKVVQKASPQDLSATQNYLYYKQFDLKFKELQQLLSLLKLESTITRNFSIR